MHATKTLPGRAACRRSIRTLKSSGGADISRMPRIASSNSVNVYGSINTSSALAGIHDRGPRAEGP